MISPDTLVHNNRIPYVYILGLAHSGSTLLSFLLNAHPAIVSVGEVQFIHPLIPLRWQVKQDYCSCGQSIYNCSFWNRALAGMAARGFGLDAPDFFGQFSHFQGQSLSSRIRLRFKESLQNKILKPNFVTAQTKLAAFTESVLDVTGKSILLDSSKTPAHAQLLQQNPALNVRFLNLYRDARGVLYSWRKHMPEVSLPILVLMWHYREEIRKHMLRKLSADRVLDVKYEDLCTSPKVTLSRIFEFLNVAENDVTSGYKSTAEHHILGNSMRRSLDETIRLDEAWRVALSPKARQFYMLSGLLHRNKQNGYLS